MVKVYIKMVKIYILGNLEIQLNMEKVNYLLRITIIEEILIMVNLMERE